MSASSGNSCSRLERVYEYALGALPGGERTRLDAHILSCDECRAKLESLRPVVEHLHGWPTDLVRPPAPLWDRIAEKVAAESGNAPLKISEHRYVEPEWEGVAPGILCKLLATDFDLRRVSMLVHLEPGAEYPPHSHAGLEELFLLDGELWIDDRKLYPGDYNRAEHGTADKRVWSETGCTCVLVTSSDDVLG